MVTTTQNLDSQRSRGLSSAISFWRVVRLLFLMSFGAIFGIGCAGLSPHHAIVGAVLGALVGLAIHVFTGHILMGVIKFLREW